MSDVFLSYASKDVLRAKQVAQALIGQGWSVWWDRSILPGKTFDTVIEAELSAAKCVVVLWSQESAASRWVRAEAGEALDKGRLIPALLDDVTIPLVFRQIQAASLVQWGGDPDHPGFQQLMNAISAFAPRQSAAPEVAAATTRPAEPPRAADTVRATTAEQPAPTDAGTRPSVDDQAATARRSATAPWLISSLLLVAVAGLSAYVVYDRRVPTEPPTAPLIAADEPARAMPPEQPVDPPPEAAAPTVASTEPAGDIESAAESDASPARPTEPAPVRSAAVKPSAAVAATPRPDPPAATAEPTAPVAAPAPVRRPAPAPVVARAAPPEPVVTPLKILTVTWAMPSDKGVASDAKVKAYSASLSGLMAAVIRDTAQGPVDLDYFYPSQQQHYQLVKDNGDFPQYRTLCSTHNPDLVIAGFVPGAQFVSASYGYALTRDPVFAVFDCRNNRRVSHSDQVAENNADAFPYENGLRKTFRELIEQKAPVDGYRSP